MIPRLATMAPWCREIVLPASVLALLVAIGSAGSGTNGAAPIVNRIAPSLAADAKFADRVTADQPHTVVNSDFVKTANALAAIATAGATPVAQEPGVATSSIDSSDALPPARPLMQVASADPTASIAPVAEAAAEPAPGAEAPKPVVVAALTDSSEVLSQETPPAHADAKPADIKPSVDTAAVRMDRDFKLKLFHLLLAAEQAGLSPGITSAFRDDYRQSIASGLKAANDRSFHGGSFRGGYGHGLAADIVSVSGATRAQRQTSSETLWNWVDKHGKDYGVGRPYHDHDPPHVGPIDGSEYASRHAGRSARHAVRSRNAAVARADQSAVQRLRTANAAAR
jgi:hypothetical protein